MPEQDISRMSFEAQNPAEQYEVLHDAIGILIARQVVTGFDTPPALAKIAELQRIRNGISPEAPESMVMAHAILAKDFEAEAAKHRNAS